MDEYSVDCYNQMIEQLYSFMDDLSLQLFKSLEENNRALNELLETVKEIKKEYEDRTEYKQKDI